jgi:hypothetical protein
MEEGSYIWKNNYNTQQAMNQTATLERPVTGMLGGLVWMRMTPLNRGVEIFYENYNFKI